MSNTTEAKTNILLEAVKKILSDDNSTLSTTMKAIHYYIADNIMRKRLEQIVDYPAVTMDVDEQGTDLLIPTQKYLLTVSAHVKKTMAYAQTELDNLTARIEYLLNKKPASINLAVASKKLRCRLINKISGVKVTDELKEIHSKHLMFEVVLDDETVNSSIN